jgi:hypothetical protein
VFRQDSTASQARIPYDFVRGFAVLSLDLYRSVRSGQLAIHFYLQIQIGLDRKMSLRIISPFNLTFLGVQHDVNKEVGNLSLR